MNQNFGLATFGKNFGKDTFPNAAKVIKTFTRL